MPNIHLKSIQLKKVSAAFDMTSLGSGTVERQNSFVIGQAGDREAQISVKDRIAADFAKGVGVQYEAELTIELRCEEPTGLQDLEAFVSRTLDQPTLSMSNIAFGFLTSLMGLVPAVLPPVWEDAKKRRKDKHTRETDRAQTSGAQTKEDKG